MALDPPPLPYHLEIRATVDHREHKLYTAYVPVNQYQAWVTRDELHETAKIVSKFYRPIYV
jgi:hypothetical protein